jgi:hypothetical protein
LLKRRVRPGDRWGEMASSGRLHRKRCAICKEADRCLVLLLLSFRNQVDERLQRGAVRQRARGRKTLCTPHTRQRPQARLRFDMTTSSSAFVHPNYCCNVLRPDRPDTYCSLPKFSNQGEAHDGHGSSSSVCEESLGLCVGLEVQSRRKEFSGGVAPGAGDQRSRCPSRRQGCGAAAVRDRSCALGSRTRKKVLAGRDWMVAMYAGRRLVAAREEAREGVAEVCA